MSVLLDRLVNFLMGVVSFFLVIVSFFMVIVSFFLMVVTIFVGSLLSHLFSMLHLTYCFKRKVKSFLVFLLGLSNHGDRVL